MLSPAEEFWLRWHSEHSAPDLAERARVVLRAGGSPHPSAAAGQGATNAEVQQALDGFNQHRLRAFSRPELKPEHLLRLFPALMSHAEFVARLAGQLFDSTRALHNLPFKTRRLLMVAALLRPLEAAASQNGHAGLDLLQYPKLAGLGGRQQAAVACLIKFQRKGSRPDRDLQFKKLRPNLQGQLRTLAALLQAAEALDASRTQSTTLVAADLRPEGVSLRVAGASAAADTAVLQNAWLWRSVFDHTLKAVVVPAAEAAHAPPAVTLPHPDQPIATAIQRALASCLQLWQTSQPGAIKSELADQVQLESAAHQLRAGLLAFGPLLKRKPVAAVVPALRRLQQTADAAIWRETAAHDLRSFRERLPSDRAAGLEPLHKAWEQARQKQQAELKRLLGGESGALYAELVQFAGTPPIRKSQEGDLRSTAGPLLAKLMDKLAEREAAVTVQQPKTIKRYRQALSGLAVALEALGGAAILGEPAGQLLTDLGRFQSRLDRLRLSLQLDAAIGEFLDGWAEKQARDKTPQLFGAQPVLAYRQARKAQWTRLRRNLSHDWRPVRATRLRRQVAALLRNLESS